MGTKESTLVTGKCHKLKVKGWIQEEKADMFLGLEFCILYLQKSMLGFNLDYDYLSFLSGRIAALNMLKKPTKIESVRRPKAEIYDVKLICRLGTSTLPQTPGANQQMV